VVRLPAIEPEPVAAPAPPHDTHGHEARSKSGAPSRILVVDDNQDGADMLAEILAGKGYDTRVAHDAPSALRVAADFVPQVALLDIGLPVMDGYELAGHLRNLPGLSGLQLIALTGYGQDSDRKRAFEAGFQHHLIKPVDIAVIEATLLQRAPA
jgi:CheY-like chemotaxis protein